MPVKKKKPTKKSASKKVSKKKASKKVDDDFVVETDDVLEEESAGVEKKPKKKKVVKKKRAPKKKKVTKKTATKAVKKKTTKKKPAPLPEPEEEVLDEEDDEGGEVVEGENSEEEESDMFDDEGDDEEEGGEDEDEGDDEEDEDLEEESEDEDAFLFDEDEEDDGEEEGEEEKEVVTKKKGVKKKAADDGIVFLDDDEGESDFSTSGEEDDDVDMDDDAPKDIDKELVEIYENTDGTMPDMSHFQKKGRHPFLIAIIVLILSVGVLGAAAYVGMQFFDGAGDFSQEDIVISVSGEESVTAGQEVVYKIRYQNAQPSSLTNASLEVGYPEGFVFESADPAPTNDDNNVWNIDDVMSGTGDVVEVRGRIFGDIDSEHSFRVFLNYTPSNFSSEFQKVVTHRVVVSSSPIAVAISGPSEVASGASAEFTFDIEKTDDLTGEAGDLFLVVAAPDSFEKKESDVESVEGSPLRWPVVFEDDKMSVTLDGSFAAAPDVLEGALVVKVVGVRSEEREYVYSQKEHVLQFLQTDVSLGVIINGGQGDLRLQPGDMINATVIIKNIGGEPVSDVSVSLTFDAPSYDNQSLLKWADVDLSENGGILGKQLDDATRRGSISWDKTDIAGLQQLDTGEEIAIDVQLPIKTVDDIILASFESYNIEIRSEMLYTAAGEQQTVNGNTINAVVNSDLAVAVDEEITTSDDDQDVHTITWTLSNSFHDVKDLEITADVYGDVSVDLDSVDASDGSAEYDEEAKKMTWTLGAFEAGADDVILTFVVTEEKEDPSQTNLTSKVKVKATDGKTREEIIYLGDAILLLESEE